MSEPLDIEPIKARAAEEHSPSAAVDIANLLAEVEDLRRRIDEALAEPQYDQATEDRMRTVLGAAAHRRRTT